MQLSILIVNYNVTALLRKCLASVEKFAQHVDYEVIVVDNNSPDASWKILVEEFPKVKFIASEKNGGFAFANNLAAKYATGKFLLLLNPDTELEDNYLAEILNFAETQKNFGCLGVRMHDAAGNFLPESKRSVPGIINSFEKLFLPFGAKKSSKNYYRNDISETDISETEVITGAFMLIERSVYLDIGGLDERYFMYGEDIDICCTLLNSGRKNWYYGKASILHYKGESTVKNRKYYEIFYGAMQIYLDKYYRKQSPLKYLMLSFGLKVRLLSAIYFNGKQ